MTVEPDFKTVPNKLARAAHAVRDARESLNMAIRDHGVTLRDIDQFTAREACSVLAALRLFQVIQCQGGGLPSEISGFLSRSGSRAVARLSDMEHFETEAPL